MRERTYEVGQSSITLRFGDITKSKAEVLVSSDDIRLSMGGGVSAALRAAGGPGVPADAWKLVPARLGDVVVSSAGGLPAKYIFHAVTIGALPAQKEPAAIVRQTTRRAMSLLSELNCTSIAFPAIGAGFAGISPEVVAAEMATTLVESLLNAKTRFRIELYLHDRRFGLMSADDFFVFFEQFATRQLGVTSDGSQSGQTIAAPAGASPGMDPEQAAQEHRRREIHTMLVHLDARRAQVETELLVALQTEGVIDVARLATLREQLEQIGALRSNYQGQTGAAGQSPGTPKPNSVFVSSTSSDLEPHRRATRTAIEALKLMFIGMEEFAATEMAPADLIRRKVLGSESFVGILGMRYGYVDPGTGLSMTEIEYRQAIAASKPMHLFVMDTSAPITAGMVETDSVRFARLLEFKSRVLKDHTCRMFTTPEDLAHKVRDTLAMRAS